MNLLTSVIIATGVFASVAFSQAAEDPAGGLEMSATHAADLGQFENARSLYLRELDLLFAKGRFVKAASVYAAIGEMTQIHGDFAGAEASYRKALDLFKQYAQSSDLHYVTALDDLAWLDVTWGRLNEAARLFDEARDNAAQARPDDPDLLRHLDTQAAYYAVTGRYSEAQKNWNQALAIGTATYGADAPSYDNLLVHFGQASELYGDYRTAAQMFERYLNIEQKAPDATIGASRAVAAGELAHTYSLLHQFADARRWFNESLGIFQNEPGQAPLVYSMILSYLGDYYAIQHEWQNAVTQYRKSLAIQHRVLGNTRSVAVSMISLARALRKVHSKDEAKQLEAQAQDIMEAHRNPARNQTVDVLALRQEH